MNCVYVYYRVDPAEASLAHDRIHVLQKAMAHYCGLPPRLLVRCDDPTTWMEIYEGIADPECFEAALNESAETLGCAAFTEGERHVECFAPPGRPTI